MVLAGPCLTALWGHGSAAERAEMGVLGLMSDTGAASIRVEVAILGKKDTRCIISWRVGPENARMEWEDRAPMSKRR